MNNVRTSNYIATEKFIKDLIARKGIGAIIGEKGAGKTHMFRQIIGSYEERRGRYTVISVTPMKEGEKNITQIMSSMIEDISGEHVRRDTEARRRQLRRILGDTTSEIILAIDESQDLHKSTIRGLKKLHELGFGLRDRLFTIILFGQNSLKDKIIDDELGPRIKRYRVKDLTQKEKMEFIDNPKVFNEKAMDLFMRRTRKTPLSIIRSFDDLNDIRMDLGKNKIDEAIVSDYFASDLRQGLLSLNKSFRQMSNEIRELTKEEVSPATLNQYVKGTYKGNLDKLDRIAGHYLEKKDTVRAVNQ